MEEQKRKRGKRGAPYRIRWGLGVTSVTAAEWQRAITDGWIVPETGKTAVLAKGIVARLRDGVLWLRNLAAKTSAWIYTSWISIERSSPVIQGEYYRRQIERDHCGPRVVVREPEGTWMDRCDWPRALAA
jgi:hypothetical protein